MEIEEKIDKIKRCCYCGSTNFELLPLNISYLDDDKVEASRKMFKQRTLSKSEALRIASEVGLLCKDCKIGRRLTEGIVKVFFNEYGRLTTNLINLIEEEYKKCYER